MWQGRALSPFCALSSFLLWPPFPFLVWPAFALRDVPLCVLPLEMHPCLSVSGPWIASLPEMCLFSRASTLFSLDPHRGQDDLEKHRSDSIDLNYLLARLLPSCPSVSALRFSRQVSGSEALHMLFLLPGMLFPPITVCGSLSHLGFPEDIFTRPCCSTPFQVAAPSPTLLASLCFQPLAFLHHVDHCPARGGVSKPMMLKLQSPSSVGSKA